MAAIRLRHGGRIGHRAAVRKFVPDIARTLLMGSSATPARSISHLVVHARIKDASVRRHRVAAPRALRSGAPASLRRMRVAAQ